MASWADLGRAWSEVLLIWGARWGRQACFLGGLGFGLGFGMAYGWNLWRGR